MPRKSRLLPYLRETKSGRLEYVRRVPPELQKYLQDRRYLTKVLPVSSTDVQDKAVVRAWAAVNQDADGELAAARLQFEAEPKPETVEALSPRDVAGIAAEPWRQLRNAVVTGQATDELEQRVIQTVAITLNALLKSSEEGEGHISGRDALSDLWLEPVLKQLSIEPSEEVLKQIRQRYQGYSGMAQADAERLKEGDYQSSDLESKPPALPASKVTFKTLMDEWLADAGGVREIDGVGVGQDRIKVYQRAVDDCIRVTQRHYPSEIDIELARVYLKHIQEKDCATATKQRYLFVIRQLYSFGVRLGYLNVNPFSEMKIAVPKGTRVGGYRPFSQDELISIFTDLKSITDNERDMVPLLLLMTGARLSDILCLRHSDVKQSDNGVWYFDFVDCPKDKYPRTLKGGVTDERHTPLHPLLIKRGFLNRISKQAEGYIFQSRNSSHVSGWFRRILIRVGIHEKRVTGLHSLRGNAIDAWRDARLPTDVRRALTAHSSKDVQDKVYGQGLQFMPDVLFKELSKVDWSWLP